MPSREDLGGLLPGQERLSSAPGRRAGKQKAGSLVFLPSQHGVFFSKEKERAVWHSVLVGEEFMGLWGEQTHRQRSLKAKEREEGSKERIGERRETSLALF